MAAMANGDDGRDTGHIVYGVKDLGTSRQIVGASFTADDADLQTWVRSHFDPPMIFRSSRLEPEPGRIVLSLEVSRVPQYPHVVKQSLGGTIYLGQVWYRSGSQNAVALRETLQSFFQATEPMKIERLDGKIIDTLKEHYAAQGDELSMPRFLQKDEKLAEGYRIAYYPGTRREVRAGYYNGQFDHIIMLRPCRD